MMHSDYHHLESVDSTQNFAKKHVDQFDPKAFTVISADEQKHGRGRFNRSWYSPKKKSLYVTYSFFIEKIAHPIHPMTLVLALSISEVLQKLGLSTQIKWPNDLYHEGLKIGGILAEVELKEKGYQVFLAYGLNGNLSKEELEKQGLKATSLQEATERAWDLKVLSGSIETTFKRDLEIFIQKGFQPFHTSFERLSFFTGKALILEVGQKTISGQYVGVDQEGALLIQQKDKPIEKIISGEIISWE